MNISVKSIYNWYRQAIRNPKYRWWIVLGTLVYLLSPIDISPDLIPIVGEIDDIAIVALLISEVSQIAIDHVKSRNSQVPSTAGATGETIDVDAVSVD